MKKEDIIVPLKIYEKTELEKELDTHCGFKLRTVYEDIEKTYNEAIFKYAQTNIKIETDLIEPQIYKFGNQEVEIIGYKNRTTSDLNLPILSNPKEFNIEELAIACIKDNKDFETEGFSEYQNGKLNGFIEGFKKSQELSKDKLFTLEDIQKTIEMAREQTGWSDNTMEDCYDEDEIIQHITENKTK